MKKIMKSVICIALALVMCFGLTACGEFSGDFKTVATADEINTTFAKVNESEVETDIGYQLKASFEGKFSGTMGSGNINMSMSGKVSIADGVKSKFASSMSLSSTGESEGTSVSIDTKVETEMYTGDGAMYLATATYLNDEEIISTKNKVNFGTGVQDVIDSFVGYLSEGTQGIDFFSMTTAELETEQIKVYIDSSEEGTKIKFEFDDTAKGEESILGKGSVIYSFGANNLLRGFKMNYEVQGLKISIQLRPYSGSVKLPADLSGYEEA